MSIRISIEQREADSLHPRAALSINSKGRRKPEREGALRTCFQRDRDRIIHCKAFRRLKHKTQVFLTPKGDHYRTRLTHVLEVSQIARTIARALRLNEDLAEAIALGHDLGHTPFGHAGEAVLQRIIPKGFRHNEQSLRVVDVLEKQGKGLNLTEEVRIGILRHSKGKNGKLLPEPGADDDTTLEGNIVRVADIIAYLNHDLDDALCAGVIKKNDLPSDITNTLGNRNSKRINTMVEDFVETSLASDLSALGMSSKVSDALEKLRGFLNTRVYEDPGTVAEFKKASKIMTDLFDYYMDNPDKIMGAVPSAPNNDRRTMVCDFIAGMTDNYAIESYERLFVPKRWEVY